MEMVAALLVVYVCFRFIHGFQSRGPSEHCYYDKFEPRCDDDEVILIINALYGRMKFGRCVKTNFGFIGCYDDVTHLLQERCLTRRGCSVEVVEPTFPGLKPCNVELKSYLEVEYACVKELVPDDPTSCDLRLDLNVAALTPDVIATSSVFGGVTCGNGQSPFRIKVEQGQRINVSMVTLQSKAEVENVNRKRSIFIGHDYVSEYRVNDDEDGDDDDDDMNSHSSSYYDGGARDEYDDYNNDDDDNDDDDDDVHDDEEEYADLESDNVITAKVIDGLFHHGGAQSLSGIESPSTSSSTSSSSSSSPSSSSSSSSSTTTSSSSASFSLPSVVTTLNESSLVPPSSSSSSSSRSSVATWRSASPRTAFITSSSVTSSSTASSSMTSSPASFSPSILFPSQSSSSSGETIRSRDRGRRTRRSHPPPPLRRHLPLHQISKRLSDLSASPPCRQMGRIVEPRAPQVMSELCGGRGNKLHHVISSQSNSLEIYLEERRERFMLLFGG